MTSRRAASFGLRERDMMVERAVAVHSPTPISDSGSEGGWWVRGACARAVLYNLLVVV